MPSAPAQVAGASSKSDPPAVVSPRLQPSPVRDPAPSPRDEAAIARVNDKLRAAQEEELKQLAQRGIAQPEGMVVIPAGEFLMGAEDGLQDARPLHRVHLSSYWFDKYEVTNARYRQCVEGGSCIKRSTDNRLGLLLKSGSRKIGCCVDIWISQPNPMPMVI